MKALKKAQKKAAQKAKKAVAQGLPPPPMPAEEDFLPKVRLLQDQVTNSWVSGQDRHPGLDS